MTEQITMIPARLKNAAVNGHVAGAADIIDDAKAKTQDVINQDVDTAIGDDDVEGSIKGRIKALEEAVGPGGSVEEQIDAKVATLDASVSQTAGADGLALSVTEVDGIVTSVSGSIAANTYDTYGSASAEATRAQGAEGTIATNLSNEITRAQGAEQQNASDIDAIEAKIPTQASSTNQLADKSFVNSSISTATATFRGTSEAGLTEQQFLAWANALTKDANDYVFWNTADAAGNVQFKRYKYNGTTWEYEYTLNNSSFTSEQWAAIQSGITSALTTKLSALPTNAELNTLLAGKEDVISDLATIRSGAAAGATAYQKPSTGIPSTDLTSVAQASLGKADTAVQPADLATVATSGSYNDLTDKPSIPAGQVQSDWNQTVTSEVDYIKNKPTNVSAFTNDAGYLTQHQSLDNYYTKTQTDGLLGNKQDTLVSGINIKTINNNSLLGSGNIDIQTGGTYTGGNGIDIANDEISVKAGSNLSFDANGNLNATDTTYSVMGGSGASHASGLVPDPGATAGTTKYLREDGTWQEVNTLPEVEIGETAPTGTPKLFVDEDADPAVSIDVYTRAQVDAKIAAAPEQSTINATDYVVLKDTDGVNRKISKANMMSVVKDALADLLRNNNLGTDVTNVPALNASAFGSATISNFASVLGAIVEKPVSSISDADNVENAVVAIGSGQHLPTDQSALICAFGTWQKLQLGLKWNGDLFYRWNWSGTWSTWIKLN